MGHGESARNAFYRVEFKCLLIVVIGRFEFDEDGREVVVKGGLTARPKGEIPVSVRGVALGLTFRLFREYSYYRWMTVMHVIVCGHSILSALSYDWL